MIKCKICGLKTKEAVQTASDYGADFIGFIFFEKSSRNITPVEVKNILSSIDNLPQIVAVTVNPSDEFLDDIFKQFTPDYIQLHGDETPKRVEEIKQKYNSKIIKAIPVATKEDVEKATQYNNAADMVLFDTKSETEKGGTGRSFDWGLLQQVIHSSPFTGESKRKSDSEVRLSEEVAKSSENVDPSPKNLDDFSTLPQGEGDISVEWFLSGGLKISNLKEAIETTGAEFVDISSGVEKEKGVKDIELIKQTLKSLDNLGKNI